MILKRTCPDRDVEINVGDLVTPTSEYFLHLNCEEHKPPYPVIRFTETFPGNWCVVFKINGKEEVFHPDNIEIHGPPLRVVPPRPVMALCRKQINLGV